MSSNVSVGDVYLLYSHQSIPPKKKRIILIAKEGNTYLAIFINTEPNSNYNDSKTIKEFHPKFEADGRSYLDHDSHPDCCFAFEVEWSDIMRGVRQDVDECFKGTLSNADLQTLVSLVKKSITVDRRLKIKYFGEGAVKKRNRISYNPK